MEQNCSIAKELECASVTEHHAVRKRKARKSRDKYSLQHKCQKLEPVQDVGSVLCDKNLEVSDVTVKDRQVLNLADKLSSQPPMDYSSNILNLLLYAKESFRISDAA